MKSISLLKLTLISMLMTFTTLYIADATPLKTHKGRELLQQQLACINRKIKNDVVIYTTPTCPYCKTAKKLLEKLCVNFREIDVSQDPHKRALMAKQANGKTSVPQIFINNILVGGSTDLAELNASGKLAVMYGLQCCSF